THFSVQSFAFLASRPCIMRAWDRMTFAHWLSMISPLNERLSARITGSRTNKLTAIKAKILMLPPFPTCPSGRSRAGYATVSSLPLPWSRCPLVLFPHTTLNGPQAAQPETQHHEHPAEENGIPANHPCQSERAHRRAQHGQEREDHGRDAAEHQPELTRNLLPQPNGSNDLEHACC